ncbi:post-GPI attachment to proteins factor 3-like isoform X2 [Dendronephthya gigantea]|nr:post-GPI attachment to proteins factor 3-like isoform X2 [Dendronephthya gigantea]XP_028391341.1 post-GPI attachment to proteins factor 3-like isoform X2 [Dendronephthya gigantea]
MPKHYGPIKYFLLWALLLCAISMANSSSGDRSETFQRCLTSCLVLCKNDDSYPAKLPVYLVIFGWKCPDECKYTCMHKVTHRAVARGRKIEQFYGKWPFIRLFGIQEPASVLFSIGNGLGHYFGWKMFKNHVNPHYSMYSTWKLYYIISVNAWLWSAVFHTRDLTWTERLDYFGAVSLILASIYSSFVRIVGPEYVWRCRLFGLFIATLFCCHCGYLSLIRFDYGYNMKASVTVGIINIVGWISWCLKNWKNRSYVWKCAFINISLFCLVALELWDFPPIWGILDAHAIWHFTTIPFCYFWYSFILDDARFDEKLCKVK